ncbi:hypothetical protein DMC25_01495 [Caulobacter sp. D4A]|uniref:DUF6249 domain-containing protein n=1 Tax=unclassified Caulobacter TaxID=2648921 RepID=UPI000D732306|nr:MULTISPECIES: DUF6249 domain-containing protein [unclassified Caulobacter]PXA84988.1 hypothetical protein DMC18_23390 [Caulobacter sp. D5]PXA94985.1 hypothetical protein DMC25_01495 [Caulobacter sp. D4A]
MDGGILVPLGLFAMIAAIVLVPVWLRSRNKQEMQATVRAAIERGQPLPPELIDAMTKDVKLPKESSALRDMRIGVIMIAVGAGLAVMGVILGQAHGEAFHPLLGAGAIPALIGLAYVFLSFFNPNKGGPSQL